MESTPQSYEEIGARLGLSASQVREAELRALEKLAVMMAIQAELLGYDSAEEWMASGDDRVARAVTVRGEEVRFRIYRRK
jgi:hypothetical protein